MVLVFLLLFGTVATSLAAVVDDFADTGAQVDVAETGWSGYNFAGDFNNWAWSDTWGNGDSGSNTFDMLALKKIGAIKFQYKLDWSNASGNSSGTFTDGVAKGITYGNGQVCNYNVVNENVTFSISNVTVTVTSSNYQPSTTFAMPQGTRIYLDVNTSPGSEWTTGAAVYARFYKSGGAFTEVALTTTGDGATRPYAVVPSGTYYGVRFIRYNSNLKTSIYNYSAAHSFSNIYTNCVQLTGWDNSSTLMSSNYNNSHSASATYIYFDNSVTNWSNNIFFLIGRSDSLKAVKMTPVSNASKIYYVNYNTSYDNYQIFGFGSKNANSITQATASTVIGGLTNYTSMYSAWAVNPNASAIYKGIPQRSGSKVGLDFSYDSAGTKFDVFNTGSLTLGSGTGGTATANGYVISNIGSSASAANATASAGGTNSIAKLAKSSTLTLTATAASDAYRFSHWSATSGGSSVSTSNPLVINNVSAAMTYHAVFESLAGVTISENVAGTVKFDDTAVSGTKYISKSTDVAVDITAPSGYTIYSVSGTGWTSDDNSGSNTHWTGTINTASDFGLTITYTEITGGIALVPYTDGTRNSNTGGEIHNTSGIEISSVTAGVATKGTAVSAVNAPEYAFAGWSKAGTDSAHFELYTNEACTVPYTGSENPLPTQVWIKTDGTITPSIGTCEVQASFVLVNRTVTVGRMLDIDGTGYSVARADDDTFTPSDLDGGGTYSVTSSEAFTVATSEETGYKFMGWMISSTSKDSAAASYTVDDTDLSNNYTMSAGIETYYYALYRKEYYVTVYSSYVDDDSVGGYYKVAAPPQRVTTTTPEGVTTTYSYVYSSTTAGEDAAVSSTGNFNEGNKLKIVAGDTVRLYYSALSSSEAIRGVFFNNGIRYTTEDQEHDLYKNGVYQEGGWGDESDDELDYTYEAATTLFADENYYSDERVAIGTYNDQLVTYAIGQEKSGYKAEVDQNSHIVTFTAANNYRNVDLELATKYRIFFSDSKKIDVTTEKADNYYDIGDSITALKVNAKASSTSTHTITKGSITYWVADESGNKTETQITDTSIITTTAGSPNTSTGTSQLIVFNGTMPANNIYIDLDLVTIYKISMGGKCMADPSDEGFTDFTTVNGNSRKLGTLTANNSIPNNNVGVNITDGTSVTVTAAFMNYDASHNWNTYYMFLGWYESAPTATAPDFTKPRLSTEQSFTFTPSRNMRLWAVATRTFYVGGDFTQNASTKEITYTSNGSSNTSYSNHIKMEYDTKNDRYIFEFPNIPTTNLNRPIYLRVYDTATGDSCYFWDQVDTASATGDPLWNYGWSETVDNSTNGIVKGLQPGWRNHTAGSTDVWGNYDDGKAYWYVTQALRDKGWGASVYFYYYPKTNGWAVNSTYQRTNVYISGGYNGILATNTYPSVTAATGSQITDPIGGGWTPTHETVKHYQIKNKNGKITIAKNTNSASYKVAAFLVYYINSKTVTSIKGDKITQSTNTYTTTFEPAEDCYICPIFEETNANLTIYASSKDLTKSNWGGLIAMYAWGSSALYGAFPGQLMIPADEEDTWYANIYEPNGKANPDLTGITFSNYYQGTWFTDATTITEADGSTTVPNGYNTDKKLVQTFDYREPVALYSNSSSKVGVTTKIRCSLKDGQTKTSDKTYATLTSSINPTNGTYNWEYLTNYEGTKHLDLTGKELDTESTASYYIIAQADAWYEDGVFKHTTSLGTSAGSTDVYTYPKAAYSGQYSVQWYVYDATGAFKFTTLSAGFADRENGLTYVASKLESLGLPYQDKSVKICYNTPLNYGDGNPIRYSAQWYGTVDTKMLNANVQIAVYSDGNYTQMHSATVSGLATSYINLNYDGEDYHDAVAGSAVSSGYDSYSVPLWMSSFDPLTLHTTSSNFYGWYTYDEENESYDFVTNDADFTPSFSSDVTYYAVYKAKAIYKYEYPGRTGTITYTVASPTDMKPAEISNNKTPNISERTSEIATLAPSLSDISVFNKDLVFTFDSISRTDDFTLTITGTTSIEHSTYALTAKSYDNTTTLQSISNTYNTPLVITKANIDTLVAYASANSKYFVGWYDAATEGNLLSIQYNFGISITKELTIYPRFSDSARTPISGFNPYVDLNAVSKELSDGENGTFYNDSIVRFQGERDEHATASNCGLLIIYEDEIGTGIGELTEGNLTSIATNLRLDANLGKTAKLTNKNAKAFNITCSSLSNLNRADLVFISNYANFNGKDYDVYAYYYDGDAYHFSTVTSGTYE